MYRRLPSALSLSQAINGAPALAQLAQLAEQSSAMYRCIQVLIPVPLRAQIKPGPVDGKDWCLLVNGNAAAAKIRQMLPVFRQRLREQGWDIQNVRLQILQSR